MEINDFVLKCLNANKGERFASADDMLTAWNDTIEKAENAEMEEAEHTEASRFWTDNLSNFSSEGDEGVEVTKFVKLFCEKFSISDAAGSKLAFAADEGGDEDWGPSAHVEHRTDPEERRGFFQKSRQAPGHVHGRVRARPAVRALSRVPSAELCGVAGWESAWFWSRRRVLAVPNEPADDDALHDRCPHARMRACILSMTSILIIIIITCRSNSCTRH